MERDYRLGTTYETGSMVHTWLCNSWEIKTRFQPYVSYDERQIDALNDNASQLGIGANAFSADIILN
jgi:hypothetical protein